jgi:probable phosphoglycerate mutase
MRHGQTLFNLRRKVQGWCDSPLTKLGINHNFEGLK